MTDKQTPRALIVGVWENVRQKDGSILRYYGSGAIRRIA